MKPLICPTKATKKQTGSTLPKNVIDDHTHSNPTWPVLLTDIHINPLPPPGALQSHWKWPRHDCVLQNPDHTPFKKVDIHMVYGGIWHGQGFFYAETQGPSHPPSKEPLLLAYPWNPWTGWVAWADPIYTSQALWSRTGRKMKLEVEVQNAVLSTVRGTCTRTSSLRIRLGKPSCCLVWSLSAIQA